MSNSPNQFQINASYSITSSSTVCLPDGKTIDDIESCYIKWGTFHCTFNSEADQEKEDWSCDLGDAELESIDWKRPSCVSVHAFDEDSELNYEVDYAERLGLE